MTQAAARPWQRWAAGLRITIAAGSMRCPAWLRAQAAARRLESAPDAPGWVWQVSFRNPIRYGLKKELFIASEGMYTGQVRWRFLHTAVGHHCSSFCEEEHYAAQAPYWRSCAEEAGLQEHSGPH